MKPMPVLSSRAAPREIALTFGITERQMTQPLAVANLLPASVTCYRDEELDAGDLQLLTMATKTQQRDWLKLYDESDAPVRAGLKGWLLCRVRHNSHYAEFGIMRRGGA